MPKQTLDENAAQQNTQRERLDATRAQLASALAAVPQGRHTDDMRAFEQRQQQVLSRAPGDVRELTGAALDGQRRVIDRQHSVEIALINQALATSGRMERTTPEGARRGAELLDAATRANSAMAQMVRDTVQATSRQLAEALAMADPARRRERVDSVVNDQRAAIARLDREFAMSRRDIDRRESLARNVLAPDTVAALRDAALAGVKSDEVRRVLTDRVVQRLADEALVPGSRQLQKIDDRAAVNRVKGELAEQMALAQMRDMVVRENQVRQMDRQLFLIEGDRVRDDRGRKLTDGMVVWRDAQSQLHVWRALEVKAGVQSARGLNEKTDRPTHRDERELQAYARDIARDAPRQSAPVTDSELTARIRDEEVRLRSQDTQRQAGQAAQTRERLDVSERIRVDGHPELLVRSADERRLRDVVLKVVADDALRQEDVLRLGVTTRELEAVARAYVDELMRRREA